MKILKSNNVRNLLITSALLCVGVVACTSATGEETAEQKIERAMSAAPSDISANATIMDMDGTILREGSNSWTCLPGVPLIPGDNHPMCNDAPWMAWIEAAKTGTAFSTDVIGVSYMLQGDALVNNANPAATDPNDGGMWVQDGPHLMMLFPNTEMIAALPRDPYVGGPYVMWDNTPMVHVMVPVEPKERPEASKPEADSETETE